MWQEDDMGNWCILLHQFFRTFRKQEITLPKTFFFYGNYAVFSPSSIFDDAERPRGVYKYISAINMLGIRSAFWCRMLVVISPLTSSEVPAFQNSLRLPSCTWQTPCVCLLYDLVSLSSARPSDDTLRHYWCCLGFLLWGELHNERTIRAEALCWLND